MEVELDWNESYFYVSSHWGASQLADETRDIKGSGRISNRHNRLWWPVQWVSFHCVHPATTVLLILLMTSLIAHPSVKGVTKNCTCCLVTKILNLKFGNLQIAQGIFAYALLHRTPSVCIDQPHYTPFVKGVANNWLLGVKNFEVRKSLVVCFLYRALAQVVLTCALFHPLWRAWLTISNPVTWWWKFIF